MKLWNVSKKLKEKFNQESKERKNLHNKLTDLKG